MSAFGGKADIAPASQNVRLRPDMPVQERQHETDPGQRFRTGMLLICAGSLTALIAYTSSISAMPSTTQVYSTPCSPSPQH